MSIKEIRDMDIGDLDRSELREMAGDLFDMLSEAKQEAVLEFLRLLVQAE